MRQVAGLIVKGDESTTNESDDLLQCECAYGGLFDPTSEQFGFSYFHRSDAKWDIVLDASQIADIANGSLRQFALWKCSDLSCGCLYPEEDSYCPNCDSIRHVDSDYSTSLRRLYPGEPASGIDSMVNLRKIVLAILGYVGENDGRMPPPFTRNEQGDRLHSWRSLILPFLDFDDLYAAIDFTQPWDAPVNRSLGANTPEVFCSPNTRSGHTRYAAILGPQTLWPLNGPRMISDVRSGTSYTIAVVEARHSDFPWMAPEDIDVETLASEPELSNRSLLAALIDGNATAFATLDTAEIRDLATI